MSRTRKANVRKRLRAVDAVIEAVDKSGVKCKALVCQFQHFSFVTFFYVLSNNFYFIDRITLVHYQKNQK
jgi:hypothetical protein